MLFFIGIFLLLIVILGFILFLKNVFNYNFGKSLFFSLMTIMFFNSIFSLLDILIFGRFLLIAFGIGSFIFNIVNSIIKKDNLFDYFKNFSCLIFVLAFFIIVGASYKVDVLMAWDEWSYWATMVKRLFYSNSYLDISNFHPMYYPPALTSYNYFCVKFLGMSDNSIYFSQYIKNTSEYEYNNGVMERNNNTCELIKRISYGFRNFKNMKSRILIITNVFRKEKRKYHIKYSTPKYA